FYLLSLPDALPISLESSDIRLVRLPVYRTPRRCARTTRHSRYQASTSGMVRARRPCSSLDDLARTVLLTLGPRWRYYPMTMTWGTCGPARWGQGGSRIVLYIVLRTRILAYSSQAPSIQGWIEAFAGMSVIFRYRCCWWRR